MLESLSYCYLASYPGSFAGGGERACYPLCTHASNSNDILSFLYIFAYSCISLRHFNLVGGSNMCIYIMLTKLADSNLDCLIASHCSCPFC